MSKVYPSNLTRDQYEFLSDLLPEAKPGGRPREVQLWTILNGIFYVLVEGVSWRALPGDFSPWQTVYTYFRNWRRDGTWLEIHHRLHEWTRVEKERHKNPSEAIIDSQSVKTAAMVHHQVGYDAGKQMKGRKRFLAVDTLGLVLVVLVTAAQVPERAGGKQLLQRVKAMGKQVWRLHTIWVDSGFDGSPFMRWVMDWCRWIVEVVRRPEQQRGFVVLPKRWVVERTFGWLMRCRRLVRDYELLPETSETFIYLAMIRILVRRLA
ncbi:MAG: IS5 family transposase [Halothece sp.]